MRGTNNAKPGRHWPGFFVCACLCTSGAAAQVDASSRSGADGCRPRPSRLVGRIPGWLSYAFDAMDRDHDGMLVAGELPGGRGPPLSRTQHRARLAEAFARQDRNGDGFLDAAELAAPPR